MSASPLERMSVFKPPAFPKPSGRVPPSREKVFTPLPWSDFFDDKRSVSLNDTDTFNVYVKGGDAHELKILCLHGAGYSGLTWACFAEELSRDVPCQLIAPDLRCHGSTSTSDDYKLDANTQVNDIVALVDKMLVDQSSARVFVIGHSMGGALAARFVDRVSSSPSSYTLCGLVVVDVVEGTALEALKMMSFVIGQRPSSFDSLTNAVKWCQLSGTAKNNRSARVSMPSQLVESVVEVTSTSNDLAEVDEELPEGEEGKSVRTTAGYKWRIDLLRTEPYWRGWFEGLSKIFLADPVPKLLLLAGCDRLDTDLTIGQMQGKFQMVVLPKVGHALQEDSPEAVANTIRQMLERHKLV